MGVTSALWKNKVSLIFVSFPPNNNLAPIHKQKCLCGSFGIQVGNCETTVEHKTEELHLGRLPTPR